MKKYGMKENAIFGVVCAVIIAIFAGTAQTRALELASPNAKNSYYNPEIRVQETAT